MHEFILPLTLVQFLSQYYKHKTILITLLRTLFPVTHTSAETLFNDT